MSLEVKYDGHICRIKGLKEPFPFITYEPKDLKIKQFIPCTDTLYPETIKLYNVKERNNEEYYYCLSGLKTSICNEEGTFMGTIVFPIDKPVNEKLRYYQKEAVSKALEQRRGIISIPTGGGKTYVIGEIISYFPRESVLILVPTTSLLYQTIKDISSYLGEEVGQIGDSVVNIKRVSIAIPDTLYSRAEELKDYLKEVNVLIGDEAHLLVTPTMCFLSKHLTNSYYKLGLSATPSLSPLAIGLFGASIYNLEAKKLIEEDYIEKPLIRIYKSSFTTNNKRLLEIIENRDLTNKDGSFNSYNYELLLDNVINRNTKRNEMICELALEYMSLGAGLIITSRVKPGSQADKLKEMLNIKMSALEVPILKGGNSTKVNKEIIKGLGKGTYPIVISGPNSIREGTNIPSLQWIILALAGKGGEQGRSLIQQIGRALRKNPLSNKRPIIAIIKDSTWPFNKQSITQIETVKSIYGEDSIEEL